ncbi:hypothetical protein WJX73_002352 [Symbiochloris irregularis]|uniref:Parkin co-regulated protein n=1 Tax=Symbiochloris irregularis TaxID=706552 RepID=A0AAW1PC17_9CHLO
MVDVHNVADSLFTNEYRDRKLAGKTTGTRTPAGVGSCFDATDVVRLSIQAQKLETSDRRKEPQWSQATCTYLPRSKKQLPTDFLHTGAGIAPGSGKKALRAKDGGPPVAGARMRRLNPPNTTFRRFYERSDLPIRMDHHGAKTTLGWKTDLAAIDYQFYLPIFFDGVREVTDPIRFMAIKGTEDMLAAGGDRVLPVIPQLIVPLKTALNTRDPSVVGITLQLLQRLVESCDLAGEALVPYYRQLLPICNLYINDNKNLGDRIDYGQYHTVCLGEQVLKTLAVLEARGGPDAFINIKYMVPTYESSLIH